MLLADDIPPPVSARSFLLGWQFQFLVDLPILIVVGLYLWGLVRVRRQSGRPFPMGRAWAFFGGMAVLVLALQGPFDAYADVSLPLHMTQHLLLLAVVAPLLALGAPVTLALRTVSPGVRRGFLLPILHSGVARVFTRLWLVGVLYAAALFLTHFTGFYNLALENQFVHDCEHLIYLVLAFLLWLLLVGADPVRNRPSHGQRILLLLLLMPVPAFIGVIFIMAPDVLYPYYAALPPPWGGSNALAGQATAGVIMWLPSQFETVVVVLLLAADWFTKDEARQERIEALQDRRKQRAVTSI